MSDALCQCGRDVAAEQCCLPLLRGERQAETAEELMRSRYTAFAVGDADYLWRTWHPRTRPEQVAVDPAMRWMRLDILDVHADVVEFRATFTDPESQRTGTLHERSRFAVRARRWFYVDGEVF